jgi:hypothetical protein
VAAERGQVERRAVERRPDDGRRRRSAGDERRFLRRWRPAQDVPQLDERKRRQGRRDEAEEDEPALPVQLESRDVPAYLTVSVPVIAGMGWIEQM